MITYRRLLLFAVEGRWPWYSWDWGCQEEAGWVEE